MSKTIEPENIGLQAEQAGETVRGDKIIRCALTDDPPRLERDKPIGEQTRLPTASASLASSSYTLVDLFASYDIHKNLSSYLTLSNIGDVRYKPFLANDYSPGFTAKIGLTGRLVG